MRRACWPRPSLVVSCRVAFVVGNKVLQCGLKSERWSGRMSPAMPNRRLSGCVERLPETGLATADDKQNYSTPSGAPDVNACDSSNRSPGIVINKEQSSL